MATKTIGLSLGVIFLVFIALLFIGIAGGFLGSRIFSLPLPLSSDTNQTIVPINQQVTVSPSKLAADITSSHGKSVFLLAQETPKGIVAYGTGIALTNDGVIMSVVDAAKEATVAIGEDGTVAALTLIGRDELSGISFYKASDRIVSPLGLLQHTPRTGSSFLALYRQSDTTQISAHSVSVVAPILPSEKDAPGIQKIAQLENAATLPIGTPFVDENGNLAGVVLHPETNRGIFVSDIRSALERLSANRLTYNPFTSLGFTASWRSQLDTNRTMTIGSVVSSVTKGSPADTAGLKVGDRISAVGGNAVSWDTNFLDALNANPVLLTVMRQDEQRTISISK